MSNAAIAEIEKSPLELGKGCNTETKGWAEVKKASSEVHDAMADTNNVPTNDLLYAARGVIINLLKSKL